MTPAPQGLPERFPCWVRAVYSWGGETKRDLGFMEGDLIECLNAGDGSWWTGRLRRDPRIVGSFPSNFVQVLPEDFAPPSRAASPMPHQQQLLAIAQKTEVKKSFRKPFQALKHAKSPNPQAAEREKMRLQMGGTISGSVRRSPMLGSDRRPISSMSRRERERPKTAGTSVRGGNERPMSMVQGGTWGGQQFMRSPNPSHQHYGSHSRAVSPNPSHQQYGSHSRAVSPVPPPPHSHSRPVSPMRQPITQNPYAPQAHSSMSSQAMRFGSRPHSPQRQQSQLQNFAHNDDSFEDVAPPPAPPPHRYGGSRAPSPLPMQSIEIPVHDSLAPTMDEESLDDGSDHKHTPSPFSMHFNDIMEQFQDMSVQAKPEFEQDSQPQEQQTPNIWGPDDLAKMHSSPQPRQLRPHTSMLTLSQGDSGYSTGRSFDGEESERYHAKAGISDEVDEYKNKMTQRLQELHDKGWSSQDRQTSDGSDAEKPPPIPAKDSSYNLREKAMRPLSALGSIRSASKRLKKQKSAYELGHNGSNVSRTMTLKSTVTQATNSTNSSNATDRSLMSGASMGQFSATSAGSFYRKKLGGTSPSRPASSIGFGNDCLPGGGDARAGAQTSMSGYTYHSSHDSNNQFSLSMSMNGPPSPAPSAGLHGGLVTPTLKKSGLLRRLVESARASAATARSTITSGSSSRPGSPTKLGKVHMSGFAGGTAVSSTGSPSRPASSAARDMGLGTSSSSGGTNHDWVAVRRDAYRSNSLTLNEKQDRVERCAMLDIPVIAPVEELLGMVQGNEGADGRPVPMPTDFSSSAINLQLVDRSARFITNLPPTISPMSLVQGFLCRPYRSDVQRLRAIFTWVSERVCIEEEFEGAEISVRRVLEVKRGCEQEIAHLVVEMCSAVGIHAEAIPGYLKMPGNLLDSSIDCSRLEINHWWNSVLVDGEWRMMDCALANPTNPRRSQFSSHASSQAADPWYFLAQPIESCYTHIPQHPAHQHLVPAIPTDVLMSLPCACPPYFKHGLEMVEFDTSILHMENLELSHVYVGVAEDVECVAEVEVRSFARDMDGDVFESGDTVRKPALAQAEWINGRKRFVIKSLLPGDEGVGVLRLYAGKRGLMHSIKSNPHALALALPLYHRGQNPPYTFLMRHPTPHAQRHDLYVSQPQCARLAANNTFVFSIRQHPSSSKGSPQLSSTSGRMSPNPIMRPASAMSMASVSASGSSYSNPSNSSSNSGSNSSNINNVKPAKLAIQTPSGKIIRLTRKTDNQSLSGQNRGGVGGSGLGLGGDEGREKADGTEWETVIKVCERGTWRGLVLADRSLRWCVFAEWECV